jgi:predicted nucleic acid-binding protein
MFTVDASVHISALNPHEADSAASVQFLDLVQVHEIPVFNPMLLIVEVAAAVARRLSDPERALELSSALRDLPHQTLVPLDEVLLGHAVALAVAARLRGADAIYAAVAQHYGTTLVTLDNQQLERLPPLLKTACPGDLLDSLVAGSIGTTA